MRRWWLAVAGAVLVASCGPGTPAGPPSPKDILAKPNHSGLKDGHFLVTGKFTNQNQTISVNGDGEIVYTPPGAGRFTFNSSVAGQPITFQDISINGKEYTFSTPGNGKWSSQTSTSPLGPASFTGTSAWKYIGEENLSQGKSWHASAKDKDGNNFEGWIRESDGYPVKYTLIQSGNSLTLVFDKYNSGVMISPPPASQVVQG